MKAGYLQVQTAMIEAKLPWKSKLDNAVHFFFQTGSYSGRQPVPWNAEEKRAMTLAEGIHLLAQKNRELEAELTQLKKEKRCWSPFRRSGRARRPSTMMHSE